MCPTEKHLHDESHLKLKTNIKNTLHFVLFLMFLKLIKKLPSTLQLMTFMQKLTMFFKMQLKFYKPMFLRCSWSFTKKHDSVPILTIHRSCTPHTVQLWIPQNVTSCCQTYLTSTQYKNVHSHFEVIVAWWADYKAYILLAEFQK